MCAFGKQIRPYLSSTFYVSFADHKIYCKKVCYFLSQFSIVHCVFIRWENIYSYCFATSHQLKNVSVCMHVVKNSWRLITAAKNVNDGNWWCLRVWSMMSPTPDTVSIIINNLYFGVVVVGLKNMRQCLMTELHYNGNCMHRQCILQTNWPKTIDLVHSKYEELRNASRKIRSLQYSIQSVVSILSPILSEDASNAYSTHQKPTVNYCNTY